MAGLNKSTILECLALQIVVQMNLAKNIPFKSQTYGETARTLRIVAGELGANVDKLRARVEERLVRDGIAAPWDY